MRFTTRAPYSRCYAVRRGFEPPTERLAIEQKENFVVNPYATFIPNSPPPRQEGASANFATLHCEVCIFNAHDSKVVHELLNSK